MTMTRTTTLIGILLLIATTAGFACDYCMLTQGISPLETARGKGLRIDQRYARLATLFDHGTRIRNHDELETHWTTQITGFYSLTPRLTLIATVPIVRRFERESEAGGHHGGAEHPISGGGILREGAFSSHLTGGIFHEEGGTGGSVFGLSDIALVGRYQVLARHTLTSTLVAAVQAGVRLPTGQTDARNGEGEFLGAHAQPGTGAFTYLIGGSFSYAVKRISIVANALAGFPTEGKAGDDRYEYGNNLNYDVALRYRLSGSLQARANLFGAVGIAGEYRKHELRNGEKVEGTGGHTVYVTPGVQLFYRPFIFEFSFWQPIVHDLDGRQLGETFKTFGGITFLF
ncbi:MAG: hypothetical protein D6681_14315 [Calditrichaeota bacterium]|nr:MAG: hypothetical protein D6681_14315 [Calditrichota bacterium]